MNRQVAGAAAAFAAVAACTGLLFALDDVAAAESLGVVYLLAVLGVASAYGLWPGLATAVLSAAAFNFAHIPPTGEFDVARGENLVGLVVFLAAAGVAATLSDRARARAAEAEAANAALHAAAAEREQLQEELVETAALRRSDELKTVLLRSVSHDLRTPLTAITTSAAALGSPSLAATEHDELVAGVRIEAERLSRLIDNLLDLSRLETGAAEPRQEPCDLAKIVTAALAGQPVAVFDLRLDPDLPLVSADGAQLERAFANLFDNARRHSGGHPVVIRARLAGGRVVVRVTDRGPGIPKEQLERIFEPFHHGDGPGAGSGLGLAIARGFINANGGRVRAESLPGQATTFVVEVPA